MNTLANPPVLFMIFCGVAALVWLAYVIVRDAPVMQTCPHCGKFVEPKNDRCPECGGALWLG